MKRILGVITVSIFVSCNSGNINQPKVKSDTRYKNTTLIEDSSLSDQHRDAQKEIIGTWRIFKDISRDGDMCDSTSINEGSCNDKNTEMVALVTLKADGKYTLNSGFENNHPSNDNGTWKVRGTKYGIDVLLLESHTTKSGVSSSATNAVSTYIIQNVSVQQLVLIDAEMFNIMYFIPNVEQQVKKQ